MKNNQQNEYFYSTDQKPNKYTPYTQSNNPQWEFEKVQSVYQVKNQHLNRSQQENYQNPPITNYPIRSYDHFNSNLPKQKYQFHVYPTSLQQKNRYQPENYQQKLSRNLYSKPNSQTNIVSQSYSLQYLSSQEPSFSKKGQFSVLDDFNLQNDLPFDKKQQYQSKNWRNDWNIASFAPKNIHNLSLKEKCNKVLQFIQQLKFMKQGFQSKLKQQKKLFTNELQQVKKLLFKLNIKYEKQILEFTKNNANQSRLSSSRISMQVDSKQNQLNELRLYCKRLEDQKQKSQQKYSSTLKKYQQQIEIISQELSRKISNQNEQNLPSFQSLQTSCQKCIKFQQILQSYKAVEQQVQIWKNRYRDQQQRSEEMIKRMEKEMFALQQNFNFGEKNKIQTQRKLKQKQKQILYRESQIQYRLKDIQKRQKNIQLTQMMLNKQKEDIEAKKQKISDFQFKILKQERKQKNEFKERQIFSSEYFNNSNNDRRMIIPRSSNQHDRSDSISSKGSRIDINARLKEIQMMKVKGKRNYDDSMTSRNSSKDSRYSGVKDYTLSRVSNSNRNIKDYGINLPPSSQKEHKCESSQSIKLSQKLNRLTQTLQNQLREMN